MVHTYQLAVNSDRETCFTLKNQTALQTSLQDQVSSVAFACGMTGQGTLLHMIQLYHLI
jgi:hypothetical protein